MGETCDKDTFLMLYVQIVCMIMPLFCIGLAIAVGYMIYALGGSGMGRLAWKSNVIAILEELDKEKKQANVARNVQDNENLKPVSDATAFDKPSPLPENFVPPPQTQIQPRSPANPFQ